MKIIRLFLQGISVTLLLVAIFYFTLVYNNNISIEQVDDKTIEAALLKSTNWIKNNQSHLTNENNPILWWFISRSAQLLDDKELLDIVNNYRQKTLGSTSVWNLYFNRDAHFTYFYGFLDNLPDYNKLFIYGLSCNNELANEDFIKEQLQADFCNWRPFYSSCSTHQLMGLRFIQRNNCTSNDSVDTLVKQLANKVYNQLTWDPRIGDVFVQRALMLEDSGYGHRIKAVWIQRIIENQLGDGSWASFDPLLRISDSKHIGFTYKFIDIRKPQGSLHTTAQAIYLLSLLLDREAP